MIYLIIFLSLLFLLVGLILTESNAKYLLSGYNTLTEEERSKIDITSYIRFFRTFHIYFSLSFLVLGLLIYYVIGESMSSLYIGVYPIIAYAIFIWNSSKFYAHISSRGLKISLGLLLAALAFVLYIFSSGMTENKMIIGDTYLEISGTYGEKIKMENIERISLVDALPEIFIKKNGFSAGSIKKGTFKTKERETIKLIVNAQSDKYLLILKRNGDKLYFSSKSESVERLLNQLRRKFPNKL